jgi:hypothetical protein
VLLLPAAIDLQIQLRILYERSSLHDTSIRAPNCIETVMYRDEIVTETRQDETNSNSVLLWVVLLLSLDESLENTVGSAEI